MCANPLCLNGTHTPRQSISDHRTSFQLQSHHVAHTSHKDTDNTMQPKQPLLMDIPAEPFPQSSSHADCDVLQHFQDSATKDDFLENSKGSQDNISQPPETPEPEPRSSDTLSLSPTSPLLSLYWFIWFVLIYFWVGEWGRVPLLLFFLLQAMIAYHMHSKHVCIICTPKSISAYKLHTE